MGATYSDRINGVETATAIKTPVRVATTANIALSGLQTIDGVAVSVGDRVLVWKQANAVENGIWDVSLGMWARSIDVNGVRDIVRGTLVYVTDGSQYITSIFTVTTVDPVVGGAGLSFAITAELTLAGLGGLAKANNLSDLADTPTARTNLGLVPQTSAIDTTAGRLLTQGAFGLGATGAPPTPANIDSIGTVRPTGWWTITAATLGTFPDGAADGLLLVEFITATFARQTFTYRGDVAVVGGRSYVRSRLGGSVWGAWQRIITVDAAGAADGDMLARVGGAWVRVPPGTDGQLLRSAGAGVAPVWGATLVAPGTPPVYACRAWVNFNGTGVVAIRSSGNVASITDNGTGDYTVNYITNMPHANYTWSGSGNTGIATANLRLTVQARLGDTKTVSALRITTMTGISDTALADVPDINIAIFC